MFSGIKSFGVRSILKSEPDTQEYCCDEAYTGGNRLVEATKQKKWKAIKKII